MLIVALLGPMHRQGQAVSSLTLPVQHFQGQAVSSPPPGLAYRVLQGAERAL